MRLFITTTLTVLLAAAMLMLVPCGCAVRANASTNNLYRDALLWTGQIYLAIIGDSISGGGGARGVGINALPNSISNASGGKLTVTNFSLGGSVWTNNPWRSGWPPPAHDYTMYGQITNALPLHPRWLYVHLAQNEIFPYFNTSSNLTEGYPTFWTQSMVIDISNCGYFCMTNNTRMLLGQNFPSDITNCCTDAEMQNGEIDTITNFNRGFGLICATNGGAVPYSGVYTGMYAAIEADAFGVWNSATPGYNLLNSNYWNDPVLDQLHLNQAAFDMWGPLMVSNLANFFPDPVYWNVGKLKATQLNFK